MQIGYISCSGPSFYNSCEELISLLKDYPKAEIGLQIFAKKYYKNSERYNWVIQLAQELQKQPVVLKAALHINEQWCEDFANGKISEEIQTFLDFTHPSGEPVFQRIQLNFLLTREKVSSVETLAETIKAFPKHRFIMSYNPTNAEFIQQLYKKGVVFDNLYDCSFGEGIIPKTYAPPVFSNILQGYAGGLGADNIKEELDKISAVVPRQTSIYVDAQGKLEEGRRIFSTPKARAFIDNILEWEKTHE